MILDEHIVQEPCRSRFITIEGVDRAGKSDRENLRRDELETCRLLADGYLALDAAGLAAAQAVGAIIEVECDDQAVQE